MGVGVFYGPEAIRGLLEDWIGSYEEWAMELDEFLDLGNGVALAVFTQKGKLVDNSGEVTLRFAAVGVWAEGLLVRTTSYGDIEQARTDAEQLAEERG
jgi:hypothetical protein